MKRRIWVLIPLVMTVLIAPALSEEKGGADVTGPYDVVPNWMKTIEEGVTTQWR